MSARRRFLVFLLLAVLFFIAHFVLAAYAAEWLTKTLDGNAPIERRFAPSYTMALFTLPLLRLSVLNDAIFAILVAFVLAFLRWRAILLLAILVPLLLLGGMFGAAVWLEHRTAHDWTELAPRPIGPPVRGEARSSLGREPVTAVIAYLRSEIAHDGEPVAPLPQEVDWFLVAHRMEIDALRRQLPQTDDPLQLFRMQAILLVDALQTRALDEFEAAERITDKLLHEPHHDDILYAIAAADHQLGVIRKLNPPPGFQLLTFDPHQKLIDSIAAQAASVEKIRAPWYTQPYARLCIAESAHSAAEQATIIHASPGRPLEPPAAEARPLVPFNPTGVLGGGERYAARANRLLFDRQRLAASLAGRKGS